MDPQLGADWVLYPRSSPQFAAATRALQQTFGCDIEEPMQYVEFAGEKTVGGRCAERCLFFFNEYHRLIGKKASSYEDFASLAAQITTALQAGHALPQPADNMAALHEPQAALDGPARHASFSALQAPPASTAGTSAGGGAPAPWTSLGLTLLSAPALAGEDSMVLSLTRPSVLQQQGPMRAGGLDSDNLSLRRMGQHTSCLPDQSHGLWNSDARSLGSAAEARRHLEGASTTGLAAANHSSMLLGGLQGPAGTVLPGQLQELAGFLQDSPAAAAAAASWAAGGDPVVALQQGTAAEDMELNALRAWAGISKRCEKLESDLARAHKKLRAMHQENQVLRSTVQSLMQNQSTWQQAQHGGFAGMPDPGAAHGLQTPPPPPLPAAQEAHGLPAAAAGQGHVALALQSPPPGPGSATTSSAQLPYEPLDDSAPQRVLSPTFLYLVQSASGMPADGGMSTAAAGPQDSLRAAPEGLLPHHDHSAEDEPRPGPPHPGVPLHAGDVAAHGSAQQPAAQASQSPGFADSPKNDLHSLFNAFASDGDADATLDALMPAGTAAGAPEAALAPLWPDDVEDLLNGLAAEAEAEAAMQQGPTGAAAAP